jgi:hypothetical protein
MHNDADLTRRKASRRWDFSARLHILDDLIHVLAFMNNDLRYAKTGQISRVPNLEFSSFIRRRSKFAEFPFIVLQPKTVHHVVNFC